MSFLGYPHLLSMAIFLLLQQGEIVMLALQAALLRAITG